MYLPNIKLENHCENLKFQYIISGFKDFIVANSTLMTNLAIEDLKR